MKLTVIGLLLLTVLTLWGTLYQAEHGLFLAQQRFYYSWGFLGGGWLPFPGGQLVMVVLFVNLTAAIAYLSSIRRLRWGFSLTHAGLMLMLAAGAVTFYYGSESHLVLEEGDGSNVSFSNHEWELAVWPGTGEESIRNVSAVDAKALRRGAAIHFKETDVIVEAETYYPNCLAHTEDPGLDGTVLQNGSGITRLEEKRASRSPQENRPGAILSVRRGKQQAKLLLLGEEPVVTTFRLDDTTYAFALRRKRSPLPAVVHLLDFQKKVHPGSQMAKSYSSLVSVEGDGVTRQTLISMNKPLRYEGFTFYQSSYQTFPDGREASTLAVVKNYGRLLPYVATGVVSLGMVLHFLGMMMAKVGRKPVTAGEAT